MQSTLKSTPEKYPLLGNYIFTDSPETEIATSRVSSVKSDPPGSTSDRVKEEPVQTYDPFPKKEETIAEAHRLASAHNQVKRENESIVRTKELAQSHPNRSVKQETEYDANVTVQLINEIRTNLRELQMAKRQDCSEKKLIIGPISEEPLKNSNADANNRKPSILPIDEIHVKGTPSGGADGGDGSDEEESKSPTKSRSSK